MIIIKKRVNQEQTIFCLFSPFEVLIAVTSENELWLNGWMEWILLSDGVTTGTLFIKCFPSRLIDGRLWHIILPELQRGLLSLFI